MIVTVQETIGHSRDITAEMVVAYAIRHGWHVDVTTERAITIDRATGSDTSLVIWSSGAFLSNRVVDIASILERKPHEVLADIAEGR